MIGPIRRAIRGTDFPKEGCSKDGCCGNAERGDFRCIAHAGFCAVIRCTHSPSPGRILCDDHLAELERLYPDHDDQVLGDFLMGLDPRKSIPSSEHSKKLAVSFSPKKKKERTHRDEAFWKKYMTEGG